MRGIAFEVNLVKNWPSLRDEVTSNKQEISIIFEVGYFPVIVETGFHSVDEQDFDNIGGNTYMEFK